MTTGSGIHLIVFWLPGLTPNIDWWASCQGVVWGAKQTRQLATGKRCLLGHLQGNFMMTSSNGNIFRVTGHLCGEFTGPGEFPAQRPVTRSFDVPLICVGLKGWINNREAGDFRRYRVHYDVTVMSMKLSRVDSYTNLEVEYNDSNCNVMSSYTSPLFQYVKSMSRVNSIPTNHVLVVNTLPLYVIILCLCIKIHMAHWKHSAPCPRQVQSTWGENLNGINIHVKWMEHRHSIANAIIRKTTQSSIIDVDARVCLPTSSIQ